MIHLLVDQNFADLIQLLFPNIEEEGPLDILASSQTASQISVGLSSPLTKKKKKEMEMLEEEAQELLSHFSHRNIDALLKVIRNTLEAIRKQIHASSVISFLGNCFRFLTFFPPKKYRLIVMKKPCI